MCTVYKTLSLSRSGFKHANCLLSLTRCRSIPVSVPSSISWMNARYEATTVGREMWITYNVVTCIIIHQGLENVETFSSRPRPRPRLFLQEQDQDQDFYFKTKTKTKTKTVFHVLEAPRDQDQGLETTSLPHVYLVPQLGVTPLEFQEDLQLHKTRVSRPLCIFVCMILSLSLQ